MTHLGQDHTFHLLSPPIEEGAPGAWIDGVPGERVCIRVDSRTVEGSYTVIESIVQPMIGPPIHRHIGDEIFHVLEGCLTFQCDANKFEAPAGSIVTVPAGMPHGWFNFGPAPARMIATFIPGGLEEMFLGLSQVAPEDILAYAARHNIDVLGPPIGAAAS